jgi:hypothetical protein
VLGLNQVRFRRYGVAGQAQHGIDLAGRGPDGTYTVVQCKEYEEFKSADLRAAVEKFTQGKRPFGAKRLIIAVSTVARTTQVEDELAALQDEHPDVLIELWGAEQINDVLRDRADIVSRFWTRETAETFCTGAPLPGVAAAPPNWIRVADQVLLSPLGVDGLDDQLAEADRLRASNPAAAAGTYQQLADSLAAEGFTGHAHVLRRKQLDALVEAGEVDGAVALAAELVVVAVHEADLNQGQQLRHQLEQMMRGRASKLHGTDGAGVSAATARHAQLARVALTAATHQLADSSALVDALRDAPSGLTAPEYQPLLVLLAGELIVADTIITPLDMAGVVVATPLTTSTTGAAARQLEALDDLITGALNQLAGSQSTTSSKDILLRLRLLRSHYDVGERTGLLTSARQLRLPRPHAALVLAAQARREALDGSAAEAVEHWRQAVAHAIHEGHTDDAAGWLYAVRNVNVVYGPWTDRLDEEHLLAQALPTTGSGRLIRRMRDPEKDARRFALDNRPIQAIEAARRWLADSIVLADWADEHGAAELLGDLYARHDEPERAAACYQWAGELKKLTQLAAAVGDRLLPQMPIGPGPWWQQAASLAGVLAQHDLMEDSVAQELLHRLLDLVERGQAGEIIDNPTRSLTVQMMKATCVLAGRGSREDAQAVLDLFATYVNREEDRYYRHDDQHVEACRTIAVHHPELAFSALERLFDLAEAGTSEALKSLQNRVVMDLLRDPVPVPEEPAPGPAQQAQGAALTSPQRLLLRERLHTMAVAGRYEAGLALSKLGEIDQTVMQRATEARDRLLHWAEPNGHSVSFGTSMVPDSYLVTFLSQQDRRECLDKMLAIAFDRREAASNRQDALVAAGNLVLEQSDEVKAEVHALSRAFVSGDQDGSFLDAETTNPHPLSAMRVNFGSASLRAAGIRLAQITAVTQEDRTWVHDSAAVMLSEKDDLLVRESALTLSKLGADVVADLDATLLVGHPLPVVRELAAFVAASAPVENAQTLRALAADPDRRVRTQLAGRLRDAYGLASDSVRAKDVPQPGEHDSAAKHAIMEEILQKLAIDRRHSVRRATAGLPS